MSTLTVTFVPYELLNFFDNFCFVIFLFCVLFYFILFLHKRGGGWGLKPPSPSPCAVPVRSRSLDIGQVLFCVFMDQDDVEVHKNAKNTRPISSHLDRTSLVNKGFIIWPKDYAKRISLFRDQRGQSQAGKIGPSFPLG